MDPHQLFNSAVVAHAVGAADAMGLLDRLTDTPQNESSLFNSSLSRTRREGLLRVLDAEGIVCVDSTGISKGPAYETILPFKGFFTWLFTASGRTLAEAMTTGPPSNGDLRHTLPPRDSALIGRAAGEFGRHFIDPALRACPELDASGAILDIGCGDASRVEMLSRHFERPGIGIDISRETIAAASARLALATNVDLSLLVGDARALSVDTSPYRSVTTIVCALMGHDLWPRQTCVDTLRSWRSLAPGIKTLLLCETVRQPMLDENPMIPTLGYEFLHASMDIYIPTRDEWIGAIQDSGWQIDRITRLNTPALTDIYVCI